jgi:hypothetical protein
MQSSIAQQYYSAAISCGANKKWSIDANVVAHLWRFGDDFGSNSRSNLAAQHSWPEPKLEE